MAIEYIDGMIFPYSLEENIGITGLRPISGFIRINLDQLTVSVSLGTAPNINLKSNMFFQAKVTVYIDENIVIAQGYLSPQGPVMIRQNYTYLGEKTFSLRRCYRDKELKVEISIYYIHDSGSGSGAIPSFPAKYSKRIWYR